MPRLGLSLGWWVDLIHAWEKVVVVSTDRVAVGAQCVDRAVCVFVGIPAPAPAPAAAVLGAGPRGPVLGQPR
ncbi:hypothetical protein GCM10010259_14130 [Streptomyces daghestanicus]|uniref:Secreted protein n=1 Tax=Streptomyces daghestanicus TaxID=66885 RepID=A0ABQ3PXM0_9ACTN|nr:hypothetical protein GCM10010259_14130 [Streptomyces daghestanicus]GHI29766.1 hypothetical protein Sdagh_14960 [Streptomyces daghestanicus]